VDNKSAILDARVKATKNPESRQYKHHNKPYLRVFNKHDNTITGGEQNEPYHISN